MAWAEAKAAARNRLARLELIILRRNPARPVGSARGRPAAAAAAAEIEGSPGLECSPPDESGR